MIRHDWTRQEIETLFALPLGDLVFQAQGVHRQFFDATEIQASTLMSIKTGACPEDCAYCSQSSRYATGLVREKLVDVDSVLEQAKAARASGSSRFCMGAAWRSPHDRDMPVLLEMVRQVKALGLETCMTLGMLKEGQAEAFAQAGLDYYNHNLDTSAEYYNEIVRTRTYEDRLDTLAQVRKAGIKVCSGGILGMGEERSDRAGLLLQLATLPVHPESVPINKLVPIPGTPLEDAPELDEFELVRTIAVARILMPASWIRLSAGRERMPDSLQALCFMAGANSLFLGCKLLTTPNAAMDHDQQLLGRLGLHLAIPKPVAATQRPYYDAMQPDRAHV